MLFLCVDFRDLGNLENLDLYNSSNIVNEFFKSIGSLASLKVLSLSECGFNGTLPAAGKNVFIISVTKLLFIKYNTYSICSMLTPFQFISIFLYLFHYVISKKVILTIFISQIGLSLRSWRS